MLKKVLIITYYWPPAGGPGVQRWLKFVKYLPEFGIEPIIYCPENPYYPIIDESLSKEISKTTTIIKRPIKEPYTFTRFFSKKSTKRLSSGVLPKQKKQSFIIKLLLYIRGNFFIPDARKYWVKPSVSFLGDYLTENNINTVITTGPPHSMHLIGLQLKEKLGIEWMADFRDPWTTIGYHKALRLSNKSRKKHKDLELKVLNTADQIVVTSFNTKNEYQTKTKQPISVITNGYDTHSVHIDKKDAQFTLSHIGSLLSDRNPEILWECLQELMDENASFSELLQLQLIGVVSDDVLESIYSYGLKAHTKVLGYVSHEEAIKYQLKSQLLLLLEVDSEETKAIIPGKLFEYMSAKTPMIAIGPVASDVETIIKSTESGSYFNYHDKLNLKAQLLHYFNVFKTGSLEVKISDLKPFSRKALTETLSNLIKSTM